MPRKLILSFFAIWLSFAFCSKEALAATLSEDLNSAVAYAYFKIGTDDDYAPDLSSYLSIDAFRQQIDEIVQNKYNTMPLASVLQAQTSGQALAPRSIVLTFESYDSSFVRNVLPLLEKDHLPFVIFLSAARLDQAEQDGSSPDWDDAKSLLRSPLAEIGMVPYDYVAGHSSSVEDLTLSINRAKARFREKLDIQPVYFSYPYGDYFPAYQDILAKAGFTAAMTQNSGVISSSDNLYLLPRFTIIDSFSDPERFDLTSSALPLPVDHIQPDHAFLEQNPPHVSFTVAEGISEDDLKKMSCFASGMGTLEKTINGKSVSLQFPRKFDDTRGRVNCTIAVAPPDDDDENDAPDYTRWRWLGFRFLF